MSLVRAASLFSIVGERLPTIHLVLRGVHGRVLILRVFNSQVGLFEICGFLGPQNLEKVQNNVCDVTFYKAISKGFSGHVSQHWVQLACLLAHVLKYFVDIGRIQTHCHVL